jgi:ribonuclease BN (tRNA processing enzyme)
MKVQVVPSSADQPERQFLISYVINGVIAIDAGCLGSMRVESQQRIEHVFLSHSHLDHVASLPMFLDNVFLPGPSCPAVYGGKATLACLQRDLFNDCVWPDVMRLAKTESPFVQLAELAPEKAVRLGEISVTPIELNHVLPTFGFVIEERQGPCVAIVSDTAPTERIWQVLAPRRLDALFLEVSFPNAYHWLADRSRHHCPRTFADELQKLGRNVRTLAIHLKPAFFDTLVAELAALRLPHVEIADPRKTYEFC